MTPKPQLGLSFKQLWEMLGGSFRDGEPTGFYIYERKSIFSLTRARRWLVRSCHFKLKWTSDYSHLCCSIFTNREAAEIAAEIAANETGEMYCVKELPINKMLPPGFVNFGFQKFFHSDINAKYQSRTLDVVNRNEMETNLKLGRRVVETLKSAMP